MITSLLFVGAGASAIMVNTWSLGVEEKFYLIWPWIFQKFRNVTAILLRICIGTVLLAWLYRVVVCLFLHPPPGYLQFAFESRLDNIMIGALAAVAVRASRLPKVLLISARWSCIPLAGITLLVGSTLLQWVLPSSFHYIVGMSFDSLVIVITLIQLITLSDRKEWRWLETPLLRFFGKISYSLYLYHLPVIFTVTYLVARYHYRWRVALLSEFVFSIAFATLSYQLVERPFLRLKRRFERVGNKPGVSSLAIPFYGTRRQANTSPSRLQSE